MTLCEKYFFKNRLYLFFACTLWLIAVKSTSAYNNITSKYMLLDEEQLMKGRFLGHGKPRFLTFQTNDDDISIEMQLSVPFLTIPVKKSVNSATGLMEKFKPANINLAALGLAGTLVFASSFILPTILKLFSVDHITQGMFGRSEESGYVWIEDLGARLGRVLESKGAPPATCFGRAVCWLVKRSTDASKKGNPNSNDKIIDGLTSNKWILEMLKDTLLSEAISHGQSKESCSVKYSDCKINQSSLQHFAKTLLATMHNT
ncbi:uncharacterized protein LOC143921766 [Arctopsyche grandis]|uniref:uncharacterized protein LOC143921766 n=1 Tax=Arctopsyche grandis TaxID=121162 RepID=UPI00406D68F9